MLAPGTGDNWLIVSDQALAVGAIHEWVGQPRCGAVVLFTGAVRDHSDGRDGVELLEYEAYESAAQQRFVEFAESARREWPGVARVAIAHRVGVLAVGDPAVVVAVSAPHRDEAFAAARWLIDTVKEGAPIWKRETWEDGSDWGTDAVPLNGLPVPAS